MAVKKIQLKPGVNQEGTRYATEGGWWVTDKVRFREGTPEKIGGYARLSEDEFIGTCRGLVAWASLAGITYVGVGTNEKYYIESGGRYYDITPVRSEVTLNDPFAVTDTSTTVTVTDVAHGARDGDYVIFSGATAGGGITISGEYQLTYIDADSYTITHSAAATSTDATTGGAAVLTKYLLTAGAAYQTPTEGWGNGAWGGGGWGEGDSGLSVMRLWSHSNFGEDLVFAPRGGALYYWDSSTGLTTRAVAVTGMVGADNVPTVVTSVRISDASRFVFAFGCNELGDTVLDPMLIRWSDQESVVDWNPQATNQSGSYRLSIGSEIVAHSQTRQEILVWTDSALYSVQYLGAPLGWGAQILADNISIISPNAVATVNNATFWMGKGKFYAYDGRLQPLPCPLRQYIFNDFNELQALQTFAAVIEEFSEVWWFYASTDSIVPDKYVVFNYKENTWYMGEMTRYAWVNSGILDYPLAAGASLLIQHEVGVDDETTDTPQAIAAYAETSEFDIDDGDNFAFVRSVLTDMTFRGSTATNPSALLTLYPLKNAGAGFGTSIASVNYASITRSASGTVEEFNGQVFLRVRGRHLVLRVESSALGVQWQLGHIRLDMRPDGKAG